MLGVGTSQAHPRSDDDGRIGVAGSRRRQTVPLVRLPTFRSQPGRSERATGVRSGSRAGTGARCSSLARLGAGSRVERLPDAAETAGDRSHQHRTQPGGPAPPLPPRSTAFGGGCRRHAGSVRRLRSDPVRDRRVARAVDRPRASKMDAWRRPGDGAPGRQSDGSGLLSRSEDASRTEPDAAHISIMPGCWHVLREAATDSRSLQRRRQDWLASWDDKGRCRPRREQPSGDGYRCPIGWAPSEPTA